jgi:hypothetical protein
VASLSSWMVSAATEDAIWDLIPGQNLSDIASWADEIKGRSEYRWSSSLHYTNGQDSPPKTCDYQYERDCKNGRCVVGAIQNFTQRVSPQSGSERADRAEALKFLVHFIGDIHQPLHGKNHAGAFLPARSGACLIFS